MRIFYIDIGECVPLAYLLGDAVYGRAPTPVQTWAATPHGRRDPGLWGQNVVYNILLYVIWLGHLKLMENLSSNYRDFNQNQYVLRHCLYATRTRGKNYIVLRSAPSLFSLWEHSFHLKAGLPLVKRLARSLHAAVIQAINPVALTSLTHCGLVTPYGDIDLGQYWPR